MFQHCFARAIGERLAAVPACVGLGDAARGPGGRPIKVFVELFLYLAGIIAMEFLAIAIKCHSALKFFKADEIVAVVAFIG